MTKAERTRAFIVEKAAPVFNMKGYNGTSLSDIMEATQLTKGAIYGNFANKDEVAIAVYQYHFDGLRRRIAAALAGKQTAYEKLMAYTDYYRTNWKEIAERGGCPVLNAATEADDNLAFMKKQVQDSIKKWISDVKSIIQYGVDNGECRNGIDVHACALTFVTMLEGGMMFFKIMNDNKYLFHALDRMEQAVRQEIMK